MNRCRECFEPVDDDGDGDGTLCQACQSGEPYEFTDDDTAEADHRPEISWEDPAFREIFNS